ncbi:MAG: hypothetical protein ACOYOQ_03940 [Microthrixaceae bacterium]|jgi:pimeloyl-ACP methyl ester carboxylesterase
MAEIVLVHGAFHELWGPTRLAMRWAPSLLDGLWTAGFRVHQQDLDRINGGLRVAFWGDLFRPAPTAPDDEPSRHDEDAVDLATQVEESGPTAVGSVSAQLARRIHEETLALLATYFTDPDARDRVHRRLLERIDGGTRVVVAHSMGTVIAYQVLREHPELTVDEFVTLGSPLGDDVVTAAIARDDDGRLPWPGGVRTWTNVAAEGDLATAAAPRLAPIVTGTVGDEFVFNGVHPHDIEPYLTTTAVGRAVARGLGLGEPTAP